MLQRLRPMRDAAVEAEMQHEQISISISLDFELTCGSAFALCTQVPGYPELRKRLLLLAPRHVVLHSHLSSGASGPIRAIRHDFVPFFFR